MIMFRKKYKVDFNSLKPDISLIENTMEKFRDTRCKRSPGIPRTFVAAVAAICLLVGGIFVTNNLDKPGFQLVAYAAENGDQYVEIEENTKITLPFGKISRGKRHLYQDETGKEIDKYDVGFEYGTISIRGDNISHVKYTSHMGDLWCFDLDVAKQRRLPEKDEVKHVPTIEMIGNVDTFLQRGKEIITNYHEEFGVESFDVNWVPWYAIDMASENEALNYAYLPSDSIIIEVHFKNGKSTVKQLQLSFNDDGDLIAEVIKVATLTEHIKFLPKEESPSMKWIRTKLETLCKFSN